MNSTTKKVEMALVGIDGNAFSILGAFSSNARRQGWSKQQIDEVIKQATSGDYNNLIATIASNVQEPDEDDVDLDNPYSDYDRFNNMFDPEDEDEDDLEPEEDEDLGIEDDDEEQDWVDGEEE